MAVIKPGDFGDDRVKELLIRHLEGMHANSPPGLRFHRRRAFAAYEKSLFNQFLHLDLVST